MGKHEKKKKSNKQIKVRHPKSLVHHKHPANPADGLNWWSRPEATS